MSATNDWIIAQAASDAAFLLAWSWQALILLACVWLGLKIFRPESPAIRHHVWLFGLIAVAGLPVLASLAQLFSLPSHHNEPLSYVVELPKIVITSSSEPVVQNPPAMSSIKTPDGRPLLLGALFAVWLIGVSIALLRAAMSSARLRRVRANARLTSLADLDCAARDCETLQSGRVALGLSDEARSPALLGVFRPMIVLPADIADWTSPAERCAMLQHELAHAARRDHHVNLFQTIISAIFFFHPMVRYACRQLILEREMACDDRVISLGADTSAYAESIIKVAERSISPVGAPGGAHQLALFSAKQILERRIEMILNNERMRVIAQQWKYLILSAALIAAVAWLLVPGRLTRTGLAQPQPDNLSGKLQLVKTLGDNKAFDELIEIALRNPDAELRRLAAIRLTELEGDGSTAAMVELYNKSDDPLVKTMVIDTLGRISEIEPLTKIALSDPSPEYRQRALERIRWLKETSESRDVKVWDVSGLQDELNKLSSEPQAPPPPPPPPPPPGEMTVEAGKPLTQMRWHKDGDSVFTLLREAAYANMRRDTSFFERVLDEEFIETGPNGETLNKAQAIADVKRLDYAIKKFEFDDLSVSGNDGMAFATFLGTVYFESNGQESTVQYRYTVNFIKKDGQLKVAAIHMSRKQ
jgi:beta-lactamase regulating signal transducer with metallopeptidase domain